MRKILISEIKPIALASGCTLGVLILMFCVFAILLASSVKAAGIQSAGSSGGMRNDFSTSDSIYLRIDAGTCLPIQSAKLYIVENKDVWADGDELTDIRSEGAQEITLGTSQKLIKIWNSPQSGEYDLILDCYKDYGSYDVGDPIDGDKNIGFNVTLVAGAAIASIGEKIIADHSWQYDSEAIDLVNEMLQINLSAKGENIKLTNITVQASGTGNDAEIDKIEIYVDKNNNGEVDTDEEMIGDSQPAYLVDNGETNIPLDYLLTKDTSENILVAYTMKQTTTSGEFSLRVNSIYGTGENSGEQVQFKFDLPEGKFLDSKTKTVLPEKTCLGTLSLQLEPNPADKGSAVIAKITGLSGCQNKAVVLMTSPCGSSTKEEAASCTLEGGSCEMNFTALTSKAYNACIDKDGDGDMGDLGEYASQDLEVVESKIEEKAENETEKANISEELNISIEGEITPITGGVISEFGKKLSGTGSFFILLEVTLLLILFVLVMIMFRLKNLKVE